MHYLIGRDLDVDGRYEFIQDMTNMILTDDPYRALQVTEYDLTFIDMEYLSEHGFYALEADRFKVSLIERLLFRPVVRGYRPRIVPPPRRPIRHGLFGHRRPSLFGHPIVPKAPRPAHRPAPRIGRPFGRPGFGRKPGPGGRGGRGPGF